MKNMPPCIASSLFFALLIALSCFSSSLRAQTANPSPSPSQDSLAVFSDLVQFPGATVVDTSTTDGPQTGQQTIVHLLKTDFKYPNIRTEAIFNADNSIARRTQMVADHFLVTLAPGENSQTFLTGMGSQAISILPVTPDDPHLYRVTLTSSSIMALPNALKTASALTQGSIEPDLISRPCSETILQTHYIDYNFQYGLKLVDAPDAWRIERMASSILVAVLDSGIQTRSDLTAATDNFDFYNNSANTSDDWGHGTLCAGIIGANPNNNELCLSGLAVNTSLMDCKFYQNQNGGTISDEVRAIDYAINHHATILNCSFGHYNSLLTPSNAGSEAEFHALTRAQTAGALVVAAAGNKGTDNDITPFYPACYPLDNIISVAATDQSDALVSKTAYNWGSNYGAKTVHLTAPGLMIVSTCSNYGFFDNYVEDDNGLGSANLSGTSASAAFVSGACALLQAHFSTLSYSQIKTILLNGVDQSQGLQAKIISGGRLNIGKALKKNSGIAIPTPSPSPWKFYDPNRTWSEWWHSL